MFKYIHAYIETRARQQPEGIAITDRGDAISYRQLNDLANQFACFLRQQGIGSGDLVPIFANKSIHAVAALLGVLKSGAAYVPINLDNPTESVHALLHEINASVVCVDADLSDRYTDFSVTPIVLDDLNSIVQDYPLDNLDVVESELAYVIYTSGTTGRPKGAMISHENLCATYESWQDIYTLQETDVHLQMANFSFDVFAGDWMRALCSGATLALCSQACLLDPQKLLDVIVEEKVTVAEFVPATLRPLMAMCEQDKKDLSQFRLLVCGSDLWTMGEYRQAQRLCGDNARVINSYGSTETAIDSTYYEEKVEGTPLSDDALVPIGQPFPHATMYVLDEALSLVEPGEIGEIYIGGQGVGMGYWRQPVLTGNAFQTQVLPDTRQTETLYKTGDSARRLHDGEIAFLGRNDMLVKIHGKRVEISAVEAALLQHPDISFAIVSPKKQAEHTILHAFIQCEIDVSYDDAMHFLREKLPEYAIPKVLFLVDHIVCNSNGKVDRRAIAKLTSKPLLPELVSALDDRQKRLLALWQETLGHDNMGIHNDFYSVGGSSLTYMAVLSRVNEAFGVNLMPACDMRTIHAFSENIKIQEEERIMKKIAIIGGGPAAVSMCMQIIKQFDGQGITEPTEILVFEKGDKVGPGLPYSAREDSYILNLPKDIMEPVYGDQGKFSTWLAGVPGAPQETDFPPRYYFGDYLHELAQSIEGKTACGNITIKYHAGCEVNDVLIQDDNCCEVLTAQGGHIVNDVVFCTGHMPSTKFLALRGRPGYYHDPWEPDLYASDVKESVTIIGTRLTAIDTALRLLESNNFHGKVTMVSRSGLLPTVLSHDISPRNLKYLTLENLVETVYLRKESLTLEILLELFFREVSEAEGRVISLDSIAKSYRDVSPKDWLDQEIELAEAGPKPWQQVLFAIYPLVPQIWSMLDMRNKKEFIKKYRGLFLTYMAAFPLENAYKIRDYLMSGRLEVWGGVKEVDECMGDNFYIAFESNRKSLIVPTVINATGPGTEPIAQPLYQRLIRRGDVDRHHAGGIDVDPGALEVRCHRKGMYAVGEVTWGSCLATTDMTRVAMQSRRVASRIAQQCLAMERSREQAKKPVTRSPESTFFRRQNQFAPIKQERDLKHVKHFHHQSRTFFHDDMLSSRLVVS